MGWCSPWWHRQGKWLLEKTKLSHPHDSRSCCAATFPKLCKIIILNGQPVSVRDDAGFHRLLKDAYPWHIIPARATLGMTFLPSLFRAARDHVKAQLSHTRAMHFTSYIWTFPLQEYVYLLLTAHGWQPEGFQGRGAGRTSIRQDVRGCWVGCCQALLQVTGWGAHSSQHL